ncbi:hypothetical protein HRR80_9619 [Exophiala dermatitidis]|uniref:Uncharacterized protein n=1 Tax=Exophiala dermatitidis TaxID=5970 RepID=A0AAN6EWW1_EXODE|nr:hypothetical protein HRR76_009598 [Exophiala dermatitidis]KAJ4571958.1 hypothetical protein HRR79_003165 [Exophiala dermatitidis]KAJ4618783.1 hypothetical protein HRR85_009611 [Exophiala dermatitidis]KAJ4633514.1 hypothetical protein HRR86_000991 [Exophiala dermatitidis]KAJ4694258.1 hypothetical protein HRR87_009293 [Exophiala dermatitidis]
MVEQPNQWRRVPESHHSQHKNCHPTAIRLVVALRLPSRLDRVVALVPAIVLHSSDLAALVGLVRCNAAKCSALITGPLNGQPDTYHHPFKLPSIRNWVLIRPCSTLVAIKPYETLAFPVYLDRYLELPPRYSSACC